jgi:signal transduction histidine kinase
MTQKAIDEPATALSTLPAEAGGRRIALAMVLILVVCFLLTAPFAKTPLAPVWAFIPFYASALIVNDLITAVLLFAQFRVLRSRALLVLASGYLFTAFITVAHALTFPGLFAPGGLLGAGSQTTAWMYMFWHGAFPLFVIAYALLKESGQRTDAERGRAGIAIVSIVVAVLAAVCGLTLLTTVGHDLFPAIMIGNHYTPAMIFTVSTVWGLSLLALLTLWRRRPHAVLDLWLMVVMCAWLFDIALSAVLNGGRFDLGFYTGRIYGLLAASLVLVMLLLENSALYVRLAEANGRHARRLTLLHEIDRAVAAKESPETIGGAVIQPLRELLGVPRAIINIFDLATGQVEWLAAAGRHHTHVGPGVRYSIQLMGDVEELKRGKPQVIDTHALPPGPDKDALLASGVHVYMAMPMIVGGELIGAISFGGELRAFPAEQVNIAREVATQLAIALTQAQLYERVRRQAEELEQRVRERTSELQAAVKELEAFSYSISHDLRSPLRAIDGFTAMLETDYADRLDAEARRLLGRVRTNSQKMGQLIDDLLGFSRLGRQPLRTQPVALDDLVREVLEDLRADQKGRVISFSVGELGSAEADPALLKQVFSNLLGNAIKFTRNTSAAVVEVGCRAPANGEARTYYVKDNGAGFDMQYADKLFGVFQRFHRVEEFEGTGVGLAIVQRIINRHGGRIWADAKQGEGAVFYFTLQPGPGKASNRQDWGT